MKQNPRNTSRRDDLISIEEAAELVGISRRGMYYRVSRGKMQPPMVVVEDHPRFRISRRALLELLERERRSSAIACGPDRTRKGDPK